MTGLGRSSLYKMIKEQKFPRPVQIGARSVAWDSTAVATWMQERISGKL
ncbi:AlpA family phage regulatory protein [Melaminivora jejuensis]|nr:AlpA family phage regulatory protein [Melaminivora jejuensis]